MHLCVSQCSQGEGGLADLKLAGVQLLTLKQPPCIAGCCLHLLRKPYFCYLIGDQKEAVCIHKGAAAAAPTSDMTSCKNRNGGFCSSAGVSFGRRTSGGSLPCSMSCVCCQYVCSIQEVFWLVTEGIAH